jgi:glycine/D-amino acid oxidase-like deaminating enzyme
MTALALAQNGAAVEIWGKGRIEEGTGFRHAAGLIEPVATEDLRATDWTREALDFCQWAIADARWGIEKREVLFLSDEEVLVTEQPWMKMMPNYRAAPEEDLLAGRRYGARFSSYVLQPDIAAGAILRSLDKMKIADGAGADRFMRESKLVSLDSVAQAASKTLERGALRDFFVLAPGIGLADFQDIEDVVGVEAGLTASWGLTIRFPKEELPDLDQVIMDADRLGYVIPQRTQVVLGGTDTVASCSTEISEATRAELETEVREKIADLVPGAEEIKGDVRLGARPMRGEVLTMYTEAFEVPGLLLGGAGGAGWTFSVGIAHDACLEIASRFGRNLEEVLTLGDRVSVLNRRSDPRRADEEGEEER